MRPRLVSAVDDGPVVVRAAKPIVGRPIPMPAIDRTLCHRCNEVTIWEPTRGGKLRCSGCGMVFPCVRACGHLDCAEVKNLT